MTVDELALFYVLVERFIVWQGKEAVDISYVLRVIAKAGRDQPCDPPFEDLVVQAREYLARRGRRALIG